MDVRAELDIALYQLVDTSKRWGDCLTTYGTLSQEASFHKKEVDKLRAYIDTLLNELTKEK